MTALTVGHVSWPDAESGGDRAALTRAIHSGDTAKLVLACRNAVREWDAPGAMWPDDWATWQRALDDTLGWGHSVQLDSLR